MNVPVVHTLGSGISAGRHFWTLNFEYIINYFQDDCLKKGRRAMVLPAGSLTSSRIFSTSFGWRTQPTAVANTHVACTVKTEAHQVRLELETPLSHLPSGLEDSCLLRSCTDMAPQVPNTQQWQVLEQKILLWPLAGMNGSPMSSYLIFCNTAIQRRDLETAHQQHPSPRCSSPGKTHTTMSTPPLHVCIC